MQPIFDRCKVIIERCLASTSDGNLQKLGIAYLRDYVKDEIKRFRIVDNSMKHTFNEVEKLCLVFQHFIFSK